MANERASSPNTSADNTGSNSQNESTSEIHHDNISKDTAGVGHSDELLKDSYGDLSLDTVFSTSEDYLSECPDCCYPLSSGSPLRPGSPQHTAYCHNQFVRSGNETSSSDNTSRQGHLFELQEMLHQYTHTIFSDTMIDQSPSTTAVDPSVLTISTAIPADDSEDIAGESHDTGEPDIDPLSIQLPHRPHDPDIQLQPAVESGKLISNDVISLDEPRSHLSKCPECQEDITRFRSDTRKRHIDEHKPGAYPCPHPECKKSKDPFKRPDKLKRHLKTCKFERQLGEMRSSS